MRLEYPEDLVRISYDERLAELYSQVILNILTPCSFASKTDGKTVLLFVATAYPELAPQKYNYVAPLKLDFNINQIDAVVARWEDGLFWKRKNPDLQGQLWRSWRPDLHSSLVVELESGDPEKLRMDRLLGDASNLLGAHFAFMHVLNPAEIIQTRMNGTIGCLNPAKQEYYLSVTSHDLKRYVPNLYWATVFGEPYVDLVGRERMLSSPAPIVKELPYGGIYIQLSDSISDMLKAYERLDAIRQNVKMHLGNNIFFDPAAPQDHEYNVPNFHLGGS